VLYGWLVKGFGRMPRADYALVIVILLVIVLWDFVAGIAVGVVAACVTFAVSSSRIRVVKRGLSRSEYGSRVDRPPEHHKQLVAHGNGIQIMWLHGFVFFGSTNRLLLDVKEIVTTQGSGVCRMVILDFHQVLGIDSSAVDSLIKLRHFAEREGLLLAVSDLPPAVERSLRAGGFLRGSQDEICRTFADLDAALEWCEEKLLAEHVGRDAAARSADEWLAQEIGGAEQFRRLKAYLTRIEFGPGEMLFAQGDAAESLYIIYDGRVSVLFKTPEGGEVRLRSMVSHTVVGEMGLYRAAPRGASVRIDEPTVVYALSREAMSRMEQDDPTLAYAFHKFIIRTLAARLDFANREVASLQQA
jgi:SulP family sulfate permease